MRIQTIAFALALFAGVANASDIVEVLSAPTVKIGEVSVSIPLTKKVDGSVCQSYISRATRDVEGKLTFEISEVCGKPVQVSSGLGRTATYPEQLLAMRFVPSGNLGVHVLDLRQ